MHLIVSQLEDELSRRRLSQVKLAKTANVPRSQLQILLKGGNVTVETLEKLAAPLGLKLALIPAELAEGAGRRVLDELLQTAERLVGAMAGTIGPVGAMGAARPTGLEPELEARIRALDKAIDDGNPPVER